MRPGDVYVAMRGARQDGRAFIAQALEERPHRVLLEECGLPYELRHVNILRGTTEAFAAVVGGAVGTGVLVANDRRTVGTATATPEG